MVRTVQDSFPDRTEIVGRLVHTSKNGMLCENMSHTSISLTYAVGGREPRENQAVNYNCLNIEESLGNQAVYYYCLHIEESQDNQAVYYYCLHIEESQGN